MAKGFHLFPSRTQKLRPSAPMVLGWTRPGRVGRRRIPKESGVEILRFPIFLSSSMAEHSAVNRVVVGSSPTWGAIPPHHCGGFLFYIRYCVPAMLLENGKNGGDACLYCLEECSRLRCWRAFSARQGSSGEENRSVLSIYCASHMPPFSMTIRIHFIQAADALSPPPCGKLKCNCFT